MIPKIIHYCWFGRQEKTELVKRCIGSWYQYCPDYRIIEWNEDNCDISSMPLFVRQAFETEKWSYVTDYIRLKVVHDYGGIYFDTDVEVIRNIDEFLSDKVFFGIERYSALVATGLGFGAEQGERFLMELMEVYEEAPLIQMDGTLDLTPCPEREACVYDRHGFLRDNTEQFLDGRIHIYPWEYFSPCDFYTGLVSKKRNTASIHWYASSWFTEEQKHQYNRKKVIRRIRRFIVDPVGTRLFGAERYEMLLTGIKKKVDDWIACL